MKPHQIRIVYGQGGKSFLSYGMIRFNDRLHSMGFTVNDDILWSDPHAIAEQLNKLDKDTKIILIGYSLGGNALTWVQSPEWGLERDIDLLIAYDPTWLSKLNPITERVKKTICYSAIGLNPAGHGVITGHNVETVKIFADHILVDYAEVLHKRTIEEIKKVVD